jgi:hypothetical protein
MLPRARTLVNVVLAALALAYTTSAAPPDWWQTRGVMDASQTHNDFAAANTGQLKHIAKQAMLEMDAHLIGGAGTAIHAMVDAWSTPGVGTNDFAAVNVGQVKAVAKLFYDRLNQAGYTQTAPWTNAIPSRNDYASANVGQLKMVFSFCVNHTPTEDTDLDSIPDWWEIQHVGNLIDASNESDQDLDGLSDFWEFIFQTNPRSRDTDGDGVGDGHEIVTFAEFGLSAVNAHSKNANVTDGQWLASIDSDNDGINDRWEIANNLDPHNAADASADQDADQLTALVEYENQSDPWMTDTDYDGIPDGTDGAGGEHANDPFNGQYPWQSLPLGGEGSTQERRFVFGTSVHSEIFDGEGSVTLTVITTASGQIFHVPENGYEPLEPLIYGQVMTDITTPRLRRFVVAINLAGQGQTPLIVDFGVERRNNMILVDFDSSDGDPEWRQGPPYNIEQPDAIPTPPEVTPLSPIDIEEVISDQIAGNDANKLPTAFFKGEPNNPMVMAARTGQKAKLRVKMALTHPKVYVGARKVGASTILGSTAVTSSVIPVEFDVPANSHDMYEVVAGYDANTNSTLDNDEAKIVFKKTPLTNSTGATATDPDGILDKIIIVDQVQFSSSKSTLNTYSNTPGSEYAGDLIGAFAEGSKTIPNSTIALHITVSSTELGISHPVGAKWNASNQDSTYRFTFADGSPASTHTESSNALKEIVQKVIVDNKAALIAAYTGSPEWPVSPYYDFSDGKEFGKTDPDPFGDLGLSELGFAFGKVTLKGKLRVSYKKTGATSIEVGGIEVIGTFDDLYDFQYQKEVKAKNASMVQAGHATLAPSAEPDSGKIFFTKVEFNTGGFANTWNGTY